MYEELVTKELGKIVKAEFGFGILTLTLEGKDWSCGTTINTLPAQQDFLESAKCSYVSGLKGKPVEVTFEGNIFKSVRILEEVL